MRHSNSPAAAAALETEQCAVRADRRTDAGTRRPVADSKPDSRLPEPVSSFVLSGPTSLMLTR